MDLTGPAGLAITAQDGDELLTLTDVRVTKAVVANGGDGSLDVVTNGSTLGSLSLTSIGREPGNPYDGTTLTANATTVAGPVTLKSGAGVRLEYTGGSTGAVSVTAGPGGFTTNDFYGATTVNGNVTVKGYRRLTKSGADLTVTGDVAITPTGSVTEHQRSDPAGPERHGGRRAAWTTSFDYRAENTPT